MARFMVKASEYKNVCKAVNDRKLAELKKEIIEILKKQDEKEVKKAVDYFNSQELHYTHLEKSFTGKWIEKAGYGIGTVRIWKGKKYKKIAPGKWARVFEKEGRGTNIAIGKLIAKVNKIDNVEDLMAFVMANKQRFVDENGMDLPVLDKLRAAVDVRNNGDMGSKGTSKLDYSAGKIWYKIRELEDVMSISYNDKESVSKNAKKAEQLEKEIQAMKDGLSAKDKKQVEEWYEEKINQNLKENFEKKKKVLNEKPAEKVGAGKVLDYKNKIDIMNYDPSDDFTDQEFQKDATKEDIIVGLKSEIENNQRLKRHYDSDEEIYKKYEARIQHKKDLIEAVNNSDELAEKILEYGKGYANKIEKPAENKKTFKQEMNELYDAQDEAWEGFESGSDIKSSPEKSKKFYERVKKFVDDNNIKLSQKHYDDIEENNGHSFNEALELAGAYGADKKEKALAKNREYSKKYKGQILDLSEIDEFKEKGSDNSKQTVKRSNVKVFADKIPIGTFSKVDDKTVEMPATKETVSLFNSLKKAVSEDEGRSFMTDCYYDGENIVSTDGRRLVCINAGDIGLPEGYIKVNTDGGKVKLEHDAEKTKESSFPNYKKVMPDNNDIEASIDNKALKDKLKEMKKDGSLGKENFDGDHRIKLEFKNGDIILDGTVVGSTSDKMPADYTLNVNGHYLIDAALSGDNTSMFLNENPMKAFTLSDGNSDTVIMPMTDGEVDYNARREKKAGDKSKKDAEKLRNRSYNEEMIKTQLEGKETDSMVEKAYEQAGKSIADFDDNSLKKQYDYFKINLDKVKDRNLKTVYDIVDKKSGATLRIAYMYAKLKEKHPDIVDKINAEMQRRGLEVQKSLFDDFLIFETEEDIDKIEEDEEEESLWNDYSAEQPELFNSVELQVCEAMNRHYGNCL